MWPPPERKRVMGTRPGASAPRFGGEGLLKEAEQGSPSVALGGKQHITREPARGQEAGGRGGGWNLFSQEPQCPHIVPPARLQELQALAPIHMWSQEQGGVVARTSVVSLGAWVRGSRQGNSPRCSPVAHGGAVGSLAPTETQLFLLAAGPRARRHDQGGGDRAAGPVVSFCPLPWARLLPSHPHAPTPTPAS